MSAYTLAVNYLHEFSAGLVVAVMVYHFLLLRDMDKHGAEARAAIHALSFKFFLATLILIGVGGVLRIFTLQDVEREHTALIAGKHAVFGVLSVWFVVHLWRKRKSREGGHAS